MANSDIRVGAGSPGGKIWRAPAGSALPGDATTDPSGISFVDLGKIDDSGVTESVNRSTQKLREWSGDPVRTITTEHDVQYTMTFLETRPEVLAIYYNDPDATAALVKITSNVAERGAYIIDAVDGDHLIRVELPDAEPVDTGSVTYISSDALKYEITFEAYADDANVKAYIQMAVVV